ncbi:hypothetical protein V8C40DRAFT_248214 [Trichoderma camerunense]
MERTPVNSWNSLHHQTPLMSTNSPFFFPSSSPHLIRMANSDTGVFGAVGAVLGYVGAEAATLQIFERLLWPQRAYANATLKSMPMLALLMPMGGPLHSAALKALDVMFTHGLFKGARVGHMLGTAFFPDPNWTYTSWASNGQKIKTEPVRNCLWVRALSYVPIPMLSSEAEEPNAGKIRAKVAVSHLTFAKATKYDINSTMPFVKADIGRPTLRVFLAVFTTELSAVLVATGTAVYYKSFWALWWLAPLLLRLVSALFAIDRKPLVSLKLPPPDDPTCDFEIHCPQYEGNFMLLTGPKSVTEQFFVHYGHPERNRFLETIQLAMVVLFGSLFPLGLFFSVMWMPIGIQKVWLCYQFYCGLAMIVMRYSHGDSGTSTEAMIAENFRKQEIEPTVIGEKKEAAILFGITREGDETMKVIFVPSYHNRFMEGQECMNTLLGRNP